MILIDSLFINNSGGKVLLDYLVEKLEESQIEAYYLFDNRCFNDFSEIPNNRKTYLKATILNRFKFYKKNSNHFKTVLCFGNLGPPIKLNARVFTYFHQTLFLNLPQGFNFRHRFIFKLKTLVFSYLLRNTDYVFVQTNFMKKGLVKKFSCNNDNILLKPFYPNEDLKISKTKKENTFIYVSSGYEHKNQFRLINSFCDFYDEMHQGKLILTINNKNFKNLSNLIDKKNNLGYPIENIGYVSRSELIKHYADSEYLIFPSLEESFGLGIVEAIECGCKVVGADLPYMHQVCDPSILFNPFKGDDIKRALIDAVLKREKPTIKKINNEINELITILEN